jgi:hypothetical protein
MSFDKQNFKDKFLICFQVTLKRINCAYDPRAVSNMTCKLTPKSRTEKKILISIYLPKEHMIQVKMRIP